LIVIGGLARKKKGEHERGLIGKEYSYFKSLFVKIEQKRERGGMRGTETSAVQSKFSIDEEVPVGHGEPTFHIKRSEPLLEVSLTDTGERQENRLSGQH